MSYDDLNVKIVRLTLHPAATPLGKITDTGPVANKISQITDPSRIPLSA